MKKCQIVVAVLAVFILLPVYAKSPEPPKWPSSVKDYVLEVRKSVKTIDMEAYRTVVDNPEGALLVDVRQEKEFTAGHVPGTINIPRGVLEFKIWKHVGFPDKTDVNRKIYVNCKTGGRCTLAAKSLQDLGFTDVTAVVMKLEDWKAAGYPLKK